MPEVKVAHEERGKEAHVLGMGGRKTIAMPKAICNWKFIRRCRGMGAEWGGHTDRPILFYGALQEPVKRLA